MLCNSLRTVSNSSSLSLICFCIALWGGRLWKLTLDPDDFKACHSDEAMGVEICLGCNSFTLVFAWGNRLPETKPPGKNCHAPMRNILKIEPNHWFFAGILAVSFREAMSLDHYHRVLRRNGLATGNNYSWRFFRALQLHRLGRSTLGDRYRGIAYKTISDDWRSCGHRFWEEGQPKI